MNGMKISLKSYKIYSNSTAKDTKWWCQNAKKIKGINVSADWNQTVTNPDQSWISIITFSWCFCCCIYSMMLHWSNKRIMPESKELFIMRQSFVDTLDWGPKSRLGMLHLSYWLSLHLLPKFMFHYEHSSQMGGHSFFLHLPTI